MHRHHIYTRSQVAKSSTSSPVRPHSIVLPAFLCVALLMGSKAIAHEAPSPGRFSLKTVESNPIPSKEHFALWKEVALTACADSVSRFNLARSPCLALVSKRSDACIAKYEAQTPAVIHTSAESRSIGRNFLYCATPYYFCHGVEVKTEAEVLAKCK